MTGRMFVAALACAPFFLAGGAIVCLGVAVTEVGRGLVGIALWVLRENDNAGRSQQP